MIIVGGVIAVIVLGCFIYLKNPMFYYYEDDCACLGTCGTRIVFNLRLYNLGFYRNSDGIHFLSRNEYKKIMNKVNKLEEKLKDYEPLDTIKCTNGYPYGDIISHISIDGQKYKIPSCSLKDDGSGCEYSIYDNETGKLIDDLYFYLRDGLINYE